MKHIILLLACSSLFAQALFEGPRFTEEFKDDDGPRLKEIQNWFTQNIPEANKYIQSIRLDNDDDDIDDRRIDLQFRLLEIYWDYQEMSEVMPQLAEIRLAYHKKRIHVQVLAANIRKLREAADKKPDDKAIAKKLKAAETNLKKELLLFFDLKIKKQQSDITKKKSEIEKMQSAIKRKSRNKERLLLKEFLDLTSIGDDEENDEEDDD
ncbi:MAG: hypothetical protein HRT89_08520 [Lentisphaeria bacterium]|nr:hypothetical protein [Lentisphaeria bacterium]NQZ68100.1 hypothetical protein [Lentisphaeria bacterium]